ncbi:MAG: PRC-barrel domain-containing protein, partial [Vulcanimicrobiaceae bacterium]
MTQSGQTDVLVKLSAANLTLADPTQDIRHRNVVDQNGAAIGHVSELFVDRGKRTLRMLQVAAGGFLGLGERHFLIPIEAVASVTPDEVRINRTCEHVVNSPAYDPSLTEAPSRDFSAYYDHFSAGEPPDRLSYPR